MQRKPKRWKGLLLSLVVLLTILEVIARWAFGLGNIPVYVSDPDYEYVYAPQQDVWRFGNHIITNNYGMRSKPINANCKVTILKIGDSVINGGSHIDQDDLSSTIIENSLQEEYGQDVSVLNISAGSWGPDNAFAFIQKHGDFNASMIVLVFSSHDLHDNMHHQPIVGNHPSWPKRKPMLAITDGFSRYVWPEIRSWFSETSAEYNYLQNHDDSPVNSGWADFIGYCEMNDIELLVYLHPDNKESANNKYNEEGQELINLLESREVPFMLGLGGYTTEMYRDNIHPNAKGHETIANALYGPIRNHVQAQNN